jgi:steroid 5-alpha reductase family enzyme
VPEPGARAVVLGGVVIVWALRLGPFLFWRVRRAGSDDRFDEIKPSLPRFLLVWTVQGLSVAFAAMAAWIGITAGERAAIDVFALVGVALIAAPVLTVRQWVALASPVFVTVLLTRVSGVPLPEKKAVARWGGQPDYEAYEARTPVLFPRLRRGSSAVRATRTTRDGRSSRRRRRGQRGDG